MQKKKLQIWLPLLFSIAVTLGMFVGFKMRDKFPRQPFFSNQHIDPIDEIFELIKNKYVDDVDLNKLSDTAITAILNKLDPHSVYIPADKLEKANEELRGNFYGIGIEFDFFNDTLHVTQVLKNSPAEAAAIQVGDKIIKANGKSLVGKKNDIDFIKSIIRGEKGSVLPVEILRENHPITISVKRDIIPVSSVESDYMINNEIGYLRLNKFTQQSYKEFMNSLTALKKSGMKKLILDLRGNGGGILDEAVEIADEFIDGDKLITYTEGKHSPKKEYRCKRKGQFETEKLVVLADEFSASASEVLLGALQDWKRATIVGRRTFGKGLVQEQFELSNHSGLRLTIARYYTPMGRSIQRPYANGERAYYDEIENRILHGENNSVINGRKDSTGKLLLNPGDSLYQHGGILPDYYIHSDSLYAALNIKKLMLKGILKKYSFTLGSSSSSIRKIYPNSKLFASNFRLSDNDYSNILSLSDKESLEIKNFTDEEKSFIERYVKAHTARYLWNNNAYFEVLNSNDDDMKKALELLK